MLYLNWFTYGHILDTEAYIKCPEEVVLAWIERRATSGNSTLQDNPILAVRKLLRLHHPKHLPLQFPGGNLLDYYVWGAFELEIKKTSKKKKQNKTKQRQRWTEGKDNNSIYQFKQGENLQEIMKSSGDRVWNQWQFYWINLIYSICTYFHVILLNVFNKGLFSFLRNLSVNLFMALWKEQWKFECVILPGHWPNELSICQWSGRSGFNPRSSHTKD